MPQGNLRVLVADLHAVTRLGIRHLIETILPGTVVRELMPPTGNHALRAVEGGECDVLITEIALEGRDALDVVRRLRRHGNTTPVLVVTCESVKAFGLQALRAGATGFVRKTASLAELELAIRRTKDGHRYVCSELSEELASEFSGNGHQFPHELLTDREREVFLLAVRGLPVREIARALSVGTKTIYTLRSRVMRKLHAKSTADVTSYAYQRGVIESRRAADRLT